MKFGKYPCACLETAVQEVRNTELTQEMKLPEGMPDVQSILYTWGQPVVRGKEWERGSIRFSGGLMVWVLYAGEDGGEHCLEGWIPFQMGWDLPDDCPEGTIRISPLLRSVDARSVSARKLLVRAGIAAMGEAFVPMEQEIFLPEGENAPVELLINRYPLCLAKEAGEKAFALEETISMPDMAPAMETLLSFRMEPRLLEKRVLGNKLAFRGQGELHITYRGTDGKLHGWDTTLPFSQVAELSGEHGAEAQGDLEICLTGLELEDTLELKAGMLAQYVISDREMVSLCEDAYAPGYGVELEKQAIHLPIMLDSRRETPPASQALTGDGAEMVDVRFLPDFPKVRREESGSIIQAGGQVQALYYDPEGKLHPASARWEGTMPISADREVQLKAVPEWGEVPKVFPGAGQMEVKWEVPMTITSGKEEALSMVTAIKTGEKAQTDPARPSLILRRAGEERLWDLAKRWGTTVEAIRRANGLTEDPSPERMLLVPVP